MAPALLAVDWGTSSLRGALLAADGTVLHSHAAPRGLLSVPAGGWSDAFDAEFGPWLAAHPGLTCLMAGMVGSRQGWVEAAYCPCPAGLNQLAAALTWVRPGRVAIVPGMVAEVDGVPDVMRGEETQVLGAISLLKRDDALLVLPGTHSKWVTVRGGRIRGLVTHMTGECYALFRQHSILARTLPTDEPPLQPEHFDRGVRQAQAAGGLLHHLFSVRTLALLNRLEAVELASYLSGLVIGEELRAQLADGPLSDAGGAADDATREVVVVGGATLTARYQRALALLGRRSSTVGDEAAWQGLAAIARHLATPAIDVHRV